MSILERLASLLRVPTDEVEVVLRADERRARETVSRRRFMGAAAALASAPFVPVAWSIPSRFMGHPPIAWADIEIVFNDQVIVQVVALDAVAVGERTMAVYSG